MSRIFWHLWSEGYGADRVQRVALECPEGCHPDKEEHTGAACPTCDGNCLLDSQDAGMLLATAFVERLTVDVKAVADEVLFELLSPLPWASTSRLVDDIERSGAWNLAHGGEQAKLIAPLIARVLEELRSDPEEGCRAAE